MTHQANDYWAISMIHPARPRGFKHCKIDRSPFSADIDSDHSPPFLAVPCGLGCSYDTGIEF
jgi:hypothetical protein